MTSLAQPLDGLPSGYTARPFVASDAPEFTRVYAAAELADTGEVAIEEADVVSDWARPSVDLAEHTMAVFDPSGRLVAGSDVAERVRVDGAVHPQARGLGIGTALARWSAGVARSAGAPYVQMATPEGSAGEAVLEALGYRRDYTVWVLRMPAGATVGRRDLPEGYEVRQAAADELPAVHEVITSAFAEWLGRAPQSYADWCATGPGRPGFEPWMILVATDPDGAIVGACTTLVAGATAYVGELAVRPDQRRRGLAQAMLSDAFARGRDHGAPLAELATDSRTGAVDLYVALGMRVAHTWHSWRLDLPGAVPAGRGSAEVG